MSHKTKQQQECSLQKLPKPYHRAPVPNTNSFSGLHLFWGWGAFLPTTSPYPLHSPLPLQPAKENNECIAIPKRPGKDTSPQFSQVHLEGCRQYSSLLPATADFIWLMNESTTRRGAGDNGRSQTHTLIAPFPNLPAALQL